MSAHYTIFTYANVGMTGIPVDCNLYVCIDASGASGLGLWINVNGSPASPMNDATGGPGGNIHESGLYYVNVGNQFSATDFTYQATSGQGGPTVSDPLVITWTTSQGGACPDPAPDPSPLPTLTAIPAAGGIQLDWTSSRSADIHFHTIRYDVYKKTGTGSFVKITNYPNELFDWYTYLDTATVLGTNYSYYVKGVEPILGGGGDSNIVTLTYTPPPATLRASWGTLSA